MEWYLLCTPFWASILSHVSFLIDLILEFAIIKYQYHRSFDTVCWPLEQRCDGHLTYFQIYVLEISDHIPSRPDWQSDFYHERPL